MVSKNGILDFDVNAYTSSNITTNINFWTQDRQTARLVFKLTKDGVPLPLAAVTGKLVLVMSDGSRFIRDVIIIDRVEGQVEYILSDQEIKHYGNVQAELNLYYTNDQSMSVHQFSFIISKSLIDQDIVPITEYYVDEFEALRAKINELYDESIQTIDDLRAKFDDLEKIETKEGAKTKVAEALATAKEYSDAHANAKNNPHAVTKAQVGLDNVENIKQASKVDFDSHVGEKSLHVTDAERVTWNSGQLFPITDINGQVKVYIRNTEDFHDVLPRYQGFVQFGSDTNAINGVGGALRGFWLCNATGTYGQVIGFDNINRTWRKTLANGVWTSWERLLTDAEKIEWKSPPTPLMNGWKQYSTQKVQYYKNPFGEVELIGAITGGSIGFDVPAFTLPEGYRPIQSRHFIGVASSVGTGSAPQFHRTQIDTKGNVYIQSVSNTVNPAEFITFGFKFLAAPKEEG